MKETPFPLILFAIMAVGIPLVAFASSNALRNASKSFASTLITWKLNALNLSSIGKGVSFMENQASWHGTAPNDEQYAQAMADLEKVGESL